MKKDMSKNVKTLNLVQKLERSCSSRLKMFRPTEVDLLIGDASKAKEKLGWDTNTLSRTSK